MLRGEIWRVRLPFAQAGHAQAGDRPALIVQNDAKIASLPTVLVVPFTSNTTASRFAGTVVVQPDKVNGLTTPSVALVFKLRAIDKRDCTRRLGELDQATMAHVVSLIEALTSEI